MSKNVQSLPLPHFFKAKNASNWGYSPNLPKLREFSQEWARQHGIKPSGSDRTKIHMLGIDLQRDFCFPEGTLFVGGQSGTGAIDDNVRIAEFIYRNLNLITNMTFTMDTHFAFQIFTPSFWLDQNGQFVAPYTDITTDMILSGKVRPNPAIASWISSGNYAWLMREVEHYTRRLKEGDKYTLKVWPEHCVLGSDGHALAGVIQEARMFQSYVRGMQDWTEVKGGSPYSENYSIFKPEVMTHHDGKPIGQKNARLIKILADSDAVVSDGQAASHCFASSEEDLLTDILAIDPKLAKKFYIMTDCTSSVVVRNPADGSVIYDYTPETDKAFQRFADAGMHLVKSTDPIQSWPGIQL